MDSNVQKLIEFIEKVANLEKRIEPLELAHQPILGNTIQASQNRLYFPLYAESPSILTTDAFTGSLGAIIYDSVGNKNAAPAVQFYKPAEMTITDGFVVSEFFPSDVDTGASFAQVFPQNVKLKLNGSRSRVAPAWPNSPYYRITGGTNLENYNPTTDGETHIHTFTEAEIESFNDGKNSLVLQADTDDFEKIGFGKMYLLLYGYIERD